MSKEQNKKEIIYSIKVADFYSGKGELKIFVVKIGRTTNVKITLNQYRRSNLDAEILHTWESDHLRKPSQRETGIHKVAGKYAIERVGEKFIFLQKNYDQFAENISLLLNEVKIEGKGLKTKNRAYQEKKRQKKDIYVRTGYTNKKPKSFVFNNSQYKVSSWTDLIVTLCEQIYKENREDFKKVLKSPYLKGRKNLYFSKNKHDLTKDNKRIKGTDIYIETRFNANHIVGLCKKILILFGYEDGLQIEVY